ncbi:MAG TPA: extracellular solute-binding protein [Roseiarcus sp.]|nr:extracellular solute-binding protein [Roseiarcus sp.]
MSIRTLALASCCFVALAATGFADTTVTILHVNENKAAVKIWDQSAADYNAAHKGVKVEFKYLENEAFKAKLPTMLQSEASRPSAFYSWGGGVMEAQAKAGFLKDIKGEVADTVNTLSPTAVAAFTVDGKLYGLPFDTDAVPIFFNKALFAKAGLKPEEMRTWDGFLAGVKKLKGAGVTPIVVGAGEKWPMHFWYSYFVMRIGGAQALADAKAGKDGGFNNPTFVDAGKRLRELAALQPFQPGYASTSHAQSAAIFGDGKAAMDLMGSWLLGMQGPNASDGKGQPESNIGVMPFPTLPGGKGEIGDTLGGVHAFLVTPTASPETVDFLKFFSQEKYAKEAAEVGAYIPVVNGTAGYIKDPLVKQIAEMLAKTKYHQNFFDQDLGPSVGRVINDVSVEVAASRMTPQAAAAAIQEAEEQK